MSAKIVYSMSDENKDLTKQIGCMNGIFQLFDRHHFLSSKRITDQNRKRLPPGQNDSQGTQPNTGTQRTTERNQTKPTKEKHRNSTESSRTSFSSSSCSSSFSSTECHKQPHQETSNLPRTPSRELHIYQLNDPLQLNRQPVDLRDVVKDSMHRETREISIKTTTKANCGGQTLIYMDSPRPMPQPRPVQPRVTGLNESFPVVTKPRESAKDTPRFSYDGRESRFKSMVKVRELPRLSLDSRVRSMKNRDLGGMQRGYENSNNNLIQQEPGSNRRPSNVVAKLMGLEAFPDSAPNDDNQPDSAKTFPEVQYHPSSRLSTKNDENKQIRLLGSPRNSNMEFTSPRMRNVDSMKKPVTSPKFPIETAPWKQADGIKGQTPSSNGGETPTKGQESPVSSVYGEIEKRLAQLEFKKSGKDLRALKQILEAMKKTNTVLENRKEDESSDFVSQSGNNSNIVQSSRLTNSDDRQSSDPPSPMNKGATTPSSCKSPIVIMRAARFNESTRNSASSAILTESLSRPQRLNIGHIDKQMIKDQPPRRVHLKDLPSRPVHLMNKDNGPKPLKSRQAVKIPKPTSGSKLGKSSDPMNSRLQQKKPGLQKHSHHATDSSDLSRSRRQPTESGSPKWKSRTKSSLLHYRDEQLSDTSSDIRHSIHQGDATSQQSESFISIGSQMDAEVTSTYRYDKINSICFHEHEEDSAAEDRSLAEPGKPAPEQPSPVSVLDATFYKEDPPSPVRKVSHAFKDGRALSSDEAEWSLMDLDHSSNSRKPSLRFEDDYLKQESIQQLPQHVMHKNSSIARSIISEIAPIYNSTNPCQKYISEILLASGLLNDFEPNLLEIKLHPSGHLINPNLFFVLEQTKADTILLNDKYIGKKITHAEPIIQKVERKLIFDAVNEILVQKLKSEYSSKQRLSVSKLANKRPSQEQILRDVCSEVDRLQANNSKCSFDDDNDYLTSIIWDDLVCETKDWTDCHSEISWLVLDVERLIFKDLISETVSNYTACTANQPGRLCRQLFST